MTMCRFTRRLCPAIQHGLIASAPATRRRGTISMVRRPRIHREVAMRALSHGISWLLLVAALPAPAQAADFNGDGRADILWRHAVSGENALWFMNGATVTGVDTAAVTNTNWHIVGVGDFNGDGRADILWHAVSGQNAI